MVMCHIASVSEVRQDGNHKGTFQIYEKDCTSNGVTTATRHIQIGSTHSKWIGIHYEIMPCPFNHDRQVLCIRSVYIGIKLSA